MSLRTSPQTGVAIRSPLKKLHRQSAKGDADCHVASLLAMTYFFRSRRGRRPRRPGGMQIFLAAQWKTGKRGVEDAAPYDAAIFSFS